MIKWQGKSPIYAGRTDDGYSYVVELVTFAHSGGIGWYASQGDWRGLGIHKTLKAAKEACENDTRTP